MTPLRLLSLLLLHNSMTPPQKKLFVFFWCSTTHFIVVDGSGGLVSATVVATTAIMHVTTLSLSSLQPLHDSTKQKWAGITPCVKIVCLFLVLKNTCCAKMS